MSPEDMRQQLAELKEENFELWDLADDVLALVIEDEETRAELNRWQEIADTPSEQRTAEEASELRVLARKLRAMDPVHPREVTLAKFKALNAELAELKKLMRGSAKRIIHELNYLPMRNIGRQRVAACAREFLKVAGPGSDGCTDPDLIMVDVQEMCRRTPFGEAP